MKWMPDTPPSHSLPPPRLSPIPVGKWSASFFGQRDAVYVTLSHSTCAFSDGDFFNALADEDFDLLQLTEKERAQLVAVVNQEGNDTMHTAGESIFRVYFTHLVYFAYLKTSYVDQGKHFRIKLYVMDLKSFSPTPVTCSEAIL